MTEENRRRAEWIALIVLFLLAGIIGHDPWKQDETYSFGIIYHFYSTHNWLVPTNAGAPFMEKPPLYYWSATLLCHLFGSVLPLHDAARLASFFYMLVSVAFLWKLSQLFYRQQARRESMGWVTLALFLGSLGLVRHSHDMFTDVAQLSGTIIALYGLGLLACRPKRWAAGGLWLGLGTGIAFLSKGFVVPAILDITFCILCFFTAAMHSRKTLLALLVALAAAAPFLFIWPALLYLDSPPLFTEWFWNNNVGRFLGFSVGRLGAENESDYILGTVLWFAFPAFPLACVETVHGWQSSQWRQPRFLLPLAMAGSGLAILLLSASARALYLLPLLPAFALLGAPALMRVPTKLLSPWNRTVAGLFSMGAAALWAVWLCLLPALGARPMQLLHPVSGWIPLDFVPAGHQAAAFILAAALTGLWLAALRLPTRSAVNAAQVWLAGMAVIWGIMNTVLLPWFDDTKSYRSTFDRMDTFLAGTPEAGACIIDDHLGESIAPMLRYMSHRSIISISASGDGPCPLLLRRTGRGAPSMKNPSWRMVWKGHRPLDAKNEELQLYERINAP